MKFAIDASPKIFELKFESAKSESTIIVHVNIPLGGMLLFMERMFLAD